MHLSPPAPSSLPVPSGLRQAGGARAVLVGFSGGLDSTLLLNLLAGDAEQRRRGLRAIHVHHGLDAQADAWAQFCQQACGALNVPLLVSRVEVECDSGRGLEAAARSARHAAFAATLAEGETLALAHHRDDQAETFLLRALRGAGADGLAAMAPWRRYSRGWLWRPLLDRARAELLDQARAMRLEWLDDPANAALRHDRNFLRHRVMPELLQRWPQACAAFAESARLTAEASALLSVEDERALALVRSAEPQVLSAAELLSLPTARRARVLRLWVTELGLPPLPARALRELETQLHQARPDRSPVVAWAGAELRRWRDQLHADWYRPALPWDLELIWDRPQRPLRLPGGGCLAFDAGPGETPVRTTPAVGQPHLAGTLRVRARRGGERIQLPGREHSHALKHVLQSLRIPPWIRERMPLLVDQDDAVLAAGDMAISARLDAWLRACRLRLSWVRRPPD